MKRLAILLPSAALLALSCTQKAGEAGGSLPPIAVTASSGDTKAVLYNADINSTGTQICLYDVLSDSGHTRRIDGKTATYGTPYWSIADEPATGYSWLGNDLQRYDNHFFAWLTRDKDGLTPSSIFSAAPSASVSAGVVTLTIPKSEITLASTQFDFSYSDVISRSVQNADYSAVDIVLQHFLTCFAIKAHNYSNEDIVIKQVQLCGLTNTKKGEITYDTPNGTSQVTFSQQERMSAPVNLVKDPIQVNRNDGVADNIITNFGSGLSTDKEAFFLMWPQEPAELVSDISYDENTSSYSYSTSDPILVVTYTTGGSSDQIVPISLRPIGSRFGWDAGTKHMLELVFTNKEVSLTVTPLPWNFVAPVIDYNGLVGVTQPLTFKSGTCTVDSKKMRVYFKGGHPIEITFALDAPKDATWLVSKNGDFDAFEIDNLAKGEPGDGIDNCDGTIDSNQATITVYPKIVDPERDYKITLSFSVRLGSGRMVGVDSSLQPEGKYEIVLQAS